MDDNNTEQQSKHGISRRAFLQGAAVAGAAAVIAPTIVENVDKRAEADRPAGGFRAANSIAVALLINGERRTVNVEPRTTLLHALRYYLDPPLTGTKEVCDHGQCGACTVLLGGRTVYSCMTLAVDAVGKPITTVEGLAQGDQLHPIQEAFIQHDALQCGFCTPGFIMSAKALLDSNSAPTIDDVRHACSGNLCRCGSYPRVYEAVLDAAGKPVPAKG